MSDPISPNRTPQFSTAEYSGEPGTDRCKSCNQALSGSYYRLNGVTACPACAEQVKRSIPQDSHAAFTRGLLFGVGGAILGLVLYAAVGIITGWMIGYVSLAVGYIVGKAISMGSGGVGGRRYQIAAVALTYAAVSIAAVPIGISQAAKARQAASAPLSQNLQVPSEQPAANGAPAAEQRQPVARRPGSMGVELVGVALLGLASPFLALADPLHGAIGLVILFVGIRIAWKIAAGISIQILGPFNMATRAPGQAPTA
jgi:hypothetical protein